MKQVNLTTLGRWVAPLVTVLALAIAAIAVWQTHRLGQRVEALQRWTVPHDVKTVMARKQRYLDKAWHAGRAGDWDAAGWYAWQVRRMAKTVIDAGIETSNGDLARLEADMLMPRFEPLFDTMSGDDTEAFKARYRQLVDACNACHVATNHEYIRIAVPSEGVGRWDQRFRTVP